MEQDLNWPLSSIVYQIYPRSFQDSDGDGIGDLKGIIARIDYLATLGINAIWLSPIYPSPQADFGYDISDYENIDPMFGNLKTFDEFVTTAHDKSIKIMMDFVPNHTSVEHHWFLESKKNKENPKRDWYIWRDGKPDGSPPNNWLSVFGGSAWEFDTTTNQYYLHTFDPDQPDLNWRNPEVIAAMKNVLRFWMDRGVDGFRVDVPYHMFKDAEFRDEPPNPNFTQGSNSRYESLLHIYTAWLPESVDMMKQFAQVLQEYGTPQKNQPDTSPKHEEKTSDKHTTSHMAKGGKNKFMVTEAWTSLPELIKTYMTVGWKWFAPFNFSLITLPWKAEIHKQYIDEYDKALGELYLPCYVLGNHDSHRVATRIGEGQARIAAMLQLTLRGIPFVYYGEEIGMTDTEIPKDKIQDPFEKRSPGLNLGRDPERTPMQWDISANAAFTPAEPWLPVNKNYKTINAAIQEQDPHSILSLYKMLIKLKKYRAALREGIYTPLQSPAENVFAFIREKDAERVLILLNFDEKEKHISLEYPNTTVLCNATMTAIEGEKINLKDFTLAADEGWMILVSDQQ